MQDAINHLTGIVLDAVVSDRARARQWDGLWSAPSRDTIEVYIARAFVASGAAERWPHDLQVYTDHQVLDLVCARVAELAAEDLRP